jgi:hypothetical protein
MLGSVLEGKPSWSINSLPDLTGKVALVTGGNSGTSRLPLVGFSNLMHAQALGLKRQRSDEFHA